VGASPAFLSGCGVFAGGQIGAMGLATPRGNTPVVAAASAHMDVGVTNNYSDTGLFTGIDVDLRATRDYGHGDLAASLAVLHRADRVFAFGRFVGSPVGLSSRGDHLYYAGGAALEAGLGFAPGAVYDAGRVVSTAAGRGITITLRGDVESRPAQASGSVDAFVGLMVGFAAYVMGSPHN
jgi:hypothetical protein